MTMFTWHIKVLQDGKWRRWSTHLRREPREQEEMEIPGPKGSPIKVRFDLRTFTRPEPGSKGLGTWEITATEVKPAHGSSLPT
jgi:hypothetical protein